MAFPAGGWGCSRVAAGAAPRGAIGGTLTVGAELAEDAISVDGISRDASEFSTERLGGAELLVARSSAGAEPDGLAGVDSMAASRAIREVGWVPDAVESIAVVVLGAGGGATIALLAAARSAVLVVVLGVPGDGTVMSTPPAVSTATAESASLGLPGGKAVALALLDDGEGGKTGARSIGRVAVNAGFVGASGPGAGSLPPVAVAEEGIAALPLSAGSGAGWLLVGGFGGRDAAEGDAGRADGGTGGAAVSAGDGGGLVAVLRLDGCTGGAAILAAIDVGVGRLVNPGVTDGLAAIAAVTEAVDAGCDRWGGVAIGDGSTGDREETVLADIALVTSGCNTQRAPPD